jgi:hypothetical protein
VTERCKQYQQSSKLRYCICRVVPCWWYIMVVLSLQYIGYLVGVMCLGSCWQLHSSCWNVCRGTVPAPASCRPDRRVWPTTVVGSMGRGSRPGSSRSGCGMVCIGQLQALALTLLHGETSADESMVCYLACYIDQCSADHQVDGSCFHS